MHVANAPHEHAAGYRHEALFYDGTDELLEGLVPFARDAVAAREPILAVLGAPKLDALRDALDDDADGVLFADMQEVGSNPARIIPAWQRFLAEHAEPGRRMRGIGEPIWPGRRAAELAECERHEALLNIAFADPDFWLLCPYDTGALPAAVVDEARRNHPFVAGDPSPAFAGADAIAAPWSAALPEPPADAVSATIDGDSLRALRALVSGYGAAAGLDELDTAELVLAVHELVSNTVLHAGGEGRLLLWRAPDAVVCEVRDRGRIEDPLAGRVAPPGILEGGRGLWMANQLCDLVQIRAFSDGGAVRVHKRPTGATPGV
jgi:anti-sigma regulatory factor (Ser/Thr protein kinase)